MAIITPEESAVEEVALSAHEEGKAVVSSRISTPLKVAIGSSFILRLAGASTGFMLGAYLKQVVHAEADLIGLLAAVFYVTELLLAPVFGALSDLRGRKPFLVFGPLVAAVAVQIHPLTTIAAILAIGRLLEGMSTAANAPGTLGFLADATSGGGKINAALRGRVMGLYEISFVVGLVGGSVLGGQLWELVGPNGFRLMSLVYLAAAALLFFIPESLPKEARDLHALQKMAAQTAQHPVRALIQSRLKSYSELLKEPALRSFVPAWLAVNAVVGLWFAHLPPIMVRGGDHSAFGNQLLYGHFAAGQLGFVQGAFGVFFMAGIYIWSLFYARLRRTDMMLTSVAGMFVVCAALAGINNNVMPGPWGQWPLVPVLAIGVLLESGFTPVALAYLADISETRVEHRGAVMGLYSVFLGIGQLIGAAGGGVLIRVLHIGFNGLLVATFLFAVFAWIVVLRLRVKHGV